MSAAVLLGAVARVAWTGGVGAQVIFRAATDR